MLSEIFVSKLLARYKVTKTGQSSHNGNFKQPHTFWWGFAKEKIAENLIPARQFLKSLSEKIEKRCKMLGQIGQIGCEIGLRFGPYFGRFLVPVNHEHGANING